MSSTGHTFVPLHTVNNGDYMGLDTQYSSPLTLTIRCDIGEQLLNMVYGMVLTHVRMFTYINGWVDTNVPQVHSASSTKQSLRIDT